MVCTKGLILRVFGCRFYICSILELILFLGKPTYVKSEGGLAIKQRTPLFLAKHYQDTRPDSSFYYAKKALFSSSGNLEKGEAYILLAKAYYNQGIFQPAIQSLLEAEELLSDQNDSYLLPEAYNWLGTLSQRTQQYSQAKQYFQQALTLYRRQRNERGRALVLGNLGHLNEKQENYDSALHFQQEALKIYEASGDSLGLATIYDNIGSIQEDLEEFDKAYINFWNAYEINHKKGRIVDAIINLNNIGDIHRKKGDYEQALEYTSRALLESRKKNLKYQIRSAYRDLAKIHSLMGSFKKAHRYLDLAYEINAEIYSEQIAGEMAKMRTFFELDQKDQQIVLLEKDQQFDRLVRIALVAGLIIVLVVSIVIYYQQRLNTAKNIKLHEQESRLARARLQNVKLSEEKLKTELEAKTKSLTQNALHIIQKNEFLEDLKKKLREIRKSEPSDIPKKIKKLASSIDFSFNLDSDWNDFEKMFQQVHGGFYDKLKQQYPDLTPTEVRLCAMIKLNLNSNDISTIMGISQDSLRVARYRLRKKMDMEKGTNLYSHITDIEGV